MARAISKREGGREEEKSEGIGVGKEGKELWIEGKKGVVEEEKRTKANGRKRR